MNKIVTLLAALLMTSWLSLAAADEVKPYKEGPVIGLSYIKVKNGRFEEYMAFLDKDYKALMDSYKKAGLITGYAVYSMSPRNQSEPDLVLAITYPNMAALDKTDAFESVASKMFGTLATQDKASGDRDAMRTVLGGELVRELILK